MERLKWSPTYETGVPEIDDDHLKLFVFADSIHEGLVKRDSSLTRRQIEEFIARCKRHFAVEEAVLVRAGFPGLEAHKAYHASLLARANELRQICDVEIDFDKANACYEEVVSFLIDDVLRGDVAFNSYLHYFSTGHGQ